MAGGAERPKDGVRWRSSTFVVETLTWQVGNNLEVKGRIRSGSNSYIAASVHWCHSSTFRYFKCAVAESCRFRKRNYGPWLLDTQHSTGKRHFPDQCAQVEGRVAFAPSGMDDSAWQRNQTRVQQTSQNFIATLTCLKIVPIVVPSVMLRTGELLRN